MTFIHFVTGNSSGILSDIFSGIRSGILPGISSGRCSGISSGRCSGISSGISSGICSGISSGIPSGILSGISSGILSGKSSGIPSGILSSISSGILSGKSAGILSGKHSGTLSGISSGILSDILSGILSGIPSGILSGISSNILSGISSGTLCGISFGVDTRGWGPAGNTGRGWSCLRSDREHWAGILAVEVRQGTLGVDGRGWGPAGNTGRGWSWLRSGREHWAWMVVVEVRQRTLWIASRSWAGGRGGQREEEDNERRRRGEEEEEDQATDIKSNNPHLAGGEKRASGFKKGTLSFAPWEWKATENRLTWLFSWARRFHGPVCRPNGGLVSGFRYFYVSSYIWDSLANHKSICSLILSSNKSNVSYSHHATSKSVFLNQSQKKETCSATENCSRHRLCPFFPLIHRRAKWTDWCPLVGVGLYASSVGYTAIHIDLVVYLMVRHS